MVCVKITKQTLPPKPSRIYAIHSQKYTPRVNVHLRVLFHGAGGRRYLHERRCTRVMLCGVTCYLYRGKTASAGYVCCVLLHTCYPRPGLDK